MQTRLCALIAALVVVSLFWLKPASAQQATGKISGVVKDTSGAVLPGANVEVQSKGLSTASDAEGLFTIANLAPGSYALVVSYVGFSTFQTSATVAAGQTAHVSAVLNVSSESESVIVTVERAHGEVPTNLTDKNYYDRSYPLGPLASWDKIGAYFKANPNNFILDPNNPSSTYGTNPANFDLVERVTAGYLMNSIDFSRFTLVTGVRLEGTQFYSAAINTTAINPCVGLCVKAEGTYIDVLPSASLRYRIDNDSGLRLVYGRGLSRPLPQQLTTAISEDTSTAPSTFNLIYHSTEFKSFDEPDLRSPYTGKYETMRLIEL